MKRWCAVLISLICVGSARAVTITTTVDGVTYAELSSFARDISASYLMEDSTIKLNYKENDREDETVFDIRASTVKIDHLNYKLTNKIFRKADSFYAPLQDIEILIRKNVKTKEIKVVNLEAKSLEVGKSLNRTLSQNEIYENQIAVKTRSANIYQALKYNAALVGGLSQTSAVASMVSANLIGKFELKNTSKTKSYKWLFRVDSPPITMFRQMVNSCYGYKVLGSRSIDLQE
jgi:hypothetical protein